MTAADNNNPITFRFPTCSPSWSRSSLKILLSDIHRGNILPGVAFPAVSKAPCQLSLSAKLSLEAPLRTQNVPPTAALADTSVVCPAPLQV